jgi:hypothetical protein
MQFVLDMWEQWITAQSMALFNVDNLCRAWGWVP